MDWLLPIISPFLDPNQFGGFKGLSIVHYLIKFLDFIESKLDKREPHSVIAASIDLSKAFNRCDHNLIIEDLFHMKCPSWLLRLVASYLTKRTLILTYNGASSSEKHLPGGAPAGCLLGGLIFILKFNGAFLRPKIPRPIGQFFHAKYFDDVSTAASVDLKKDLQKDLVQRQKPLT